MAQEEKIINKVIPVQAIKDLADYLEGQKDEYQRLFDMEKNKNMNLKFSEQVYEYKGSQARVQYVIKFRDGKEVSEANYNWFVGMLAHIKDIDKIEFFYDISYSSNYQQRENWEYCNIHTFIWITEDTVSIRVDGKNMEEQTYRLHSYIRGIFENNEERYDKTVKNRNIRIQSLCFTIGFVLSYIIYVILLANKTKLPADIAGYIGNKYIVVFGQWFLAAVVGNVFGYPIMMSLYRNILPKTKYSHYSRQSHKSVYVDNIDDYTAHCEVQIGKNVNNGRNRELIEKIYKITSKIVLAQLVISVLLFFILK